LQVFFSHVALYFRHVILDLLFLVLFADKQYIAGVYNDVVFEAL
jgi:hypothetical protein